MTRHDLVERLASWAEATPDAVTSWLLREAADEIARLRLADAEREATDSVACPYVTGKTTLYCTLTPFTLTDAEREAISFAAYGLNRFPWYQKTLRSILARARSQDSA